jgi:hypothetical protein
MEPTENTPADAGARKSRLNSTIVAAGVAFGLTLGGLGVAAAQTDSGGDTSTTNQAPGAETTPSTEAAPAPAAPADPADRRARAQRPAETALTGDVAERVKAAALQAVPGGTVLRVETDSDGSPYEAHVRKEDGTEVVVKVNEAFAVTPVGEHLRGKGGHRGPGGGGHAPNLLTGEAAEKATAAASAAVEGGTVIRVQGEPDGSGYHAHVRKADGTEVVVRMGADFTVTGTEEGTGGGRPGGRGGPRPADGSTPPTTTD